MRHLVITVLALASVSAMAATNRILLTGFWPPTNEMLRDFSPKEQGRWKGQNWQGLGYDIYSYFPEFSSASDEIGYGDFRVDFAAAYNDFMRLTAQLKPVAIISFGRGEGPWEIEKNFTNYFYEWFESGVIPSQLGEVASHAVPRSLKESREERHSSLPLAAIYKATAKLGDDGLRPWIDEEGDAGDYLCGFLGYLAAWYHDTHNDTQADDYNAAAGFIHVSPSDQGHARHSAEASLRAVIETLDKLETPD